MYVNANKPVNVVGYYRNSGSLHFICVRDFCIVTGIKREDLPLTLKPFKVEFKCKLIGGNNK